MLVEGRQYYAIIKKSDRTNKAHYRAIRITVKPANGFRRKIYNQLHSFFDKILSANQCKFLKSFRAQNCITKMETMFISDVVFGVLLTDLLEAFDILSHE